jgi:hypothetical protein
MVVPDMRFHGASDAPEGGAYNVDALFRVMNQKRAAPPPPQLDRLGEVKAPARKLPNASPPPGRSSMLELGTCSTWKTRTGSIETWKPS